MDRIKEHLQKYKTVYLCGATGITVAGITALIMRSNIARGAMGGGNTRGALTNTASFVFNSPQTVKVTTVLDREGRGHPGWPVRNLETKRIDLSQKSAAAFFGIPENILSGHLNGKFADADGLHFERVNLAQL
jgi:hypothetical protein